MKGLALQSRLRNRTLGLGLLAIRPILHLTPLAGLRCDAPQLLLQQPSIRRMLLRRRLDLSLCCAQISLQPPDLLRVFLRLLLRCRKSSSQLNLTLPALTLQRSKLFLKGLALQSRLRNGTMGLGLLAIRPILHLTQLAGLRCDAPQLLLQQHVLL